MSPTRRATRLVTTAAWSILLMVTPLAAQVAPVPQGPTVIFEWFEYEGRDLDEVPLAAGEYRNPILAGFYPDPSICRVGEDYYLVTSSFAYFPGVPVFHSRDLIHWTPIGHALTDPEKASLAGLGVSRGVFAPTLRHHDGTFYMINTLVDAGGNFYVTATDPAGPWSDPVWLEIDGIDPSMFFDHDGRVYVTNNGPPLRDPPLYDGHRALWIQELDVGAGTLVGPRKMIVDGGVDLSRRPIWIEAPHIFKKDRWYYLIAAEGGTAEDHSEVVFRSRGVMGPYEPWDKNPILTQRTLDPDRPHPVTSTGHADFVETPDGEWWAVFLGCRPYEENLYDTGRETFLLPVTWTDDGWPMIHDPNVPLAPTARAPRLSPVPAAPMTGAFTWRDDFDGAALGPAWITLRGPASGWLRVDGDLAIDARPVKLTSREIPSFVARRQQHARFTATTALRLPPSPGVEAGIVAFQNETHHFFLGVRRVGADAEVFLERVAGKEAEAAPETIARQTVSAPLPETWWLRIEGDGRPHAFSFAFEPDAWFVLEDQVDGSILSTSVAGGFVGTSLGLHARVGPPEPVAGERP